MKQRIVYLDILKALAIFLVVWGHAIMSLSKTDCHESQVWQFIYSFHMPLFMTMVGFFSAGSLKRDTKLFIKHKFQQLLLPFLSWFAIGYVAMIIMDPNASLSQQNFSKALMNEIWFLKSAFLCYALFYFSMRSIRALNVNHTLLAGGCISILLSQIVPLMKVNQMYPCFFCGYVVYKYFGCIERHWKLISVIALGAFAISYPMLIDIRVTPMPEIKKELTSGNLSALNELALYQFRLLCLGLTASIGLVSLFYGLFRNSGESVISLIGKNTLAIYVMQTLVLEKLMAHYIDLQSMPTQLFELVAAPVISLLVIAVCMAMSRAIEKSPKMSYYLLGKRTQKKRH